MSKKIMKIGVTQFPGTNCDRDILIMADRLGLKAQLIWHEDRFDKKDFDAIVIPGGFSYGDYLRCGAMAAQSAVMKSVRDFAEYGAPVLSICNGFQILCESGLLPGVLLRNKNLNFIDKWVSLQCQSPSDFFASTLSSGEIIHLPIAHGEGRYHVDENIYQEMKQRGQIWLTYMDNPNGAVHDIAGVSNKSKNVFGLMPHPERALFDWMGGIDGRSFL